MEVHLFLPQMRMAMDAIVGRAVAAEAAGFDGIAFMDHLVPPMADDQPMFDAMVTATWVAARTSTLKVGHLVLCDAFRHPAVLAKQVASLDAASGGRFELGIGWGSVPTEYDTFGIGSTVPRERVDRLAETLAVLEALWSGETVSYVGAHHSLVGARMQPAPAGGRVPVVIGGVGPRTLELVAVHADWWNLPVHRLADIESLRPRVGAARVSIQLMVALVPPGGDREAIEATTMRRHGAMASVGGLVLGDADEVAAAFEAHAARGVERIYTWFADFAPPPTLAAFAPVLAAAHQLGVAG